MLSISKLFSHDIDLKYVESKAIYNWLFSYFDKSTTAEIVGCNILLVPITEFISLLVSNSTK